MIVTKEYNPDLREKSFLTISEETKKCILEQIGKQPTAYSGHIRPGRSD